MASSEKYAYSDRDRPSTAVLSKDTRDQDSRQQSMEIHMKAFFPKAKLVLYVISGCVLMSMLSSAIDLQVYFENQWLDGQPGFTDKEHERYQFQAVEAYVLGTGFGLAILIGLVGWWLHENNRGGRQ